MNRFFCQSKNISLDKIIIDDKEQAHHIRDVLRLKQGEKVVIFDEKGSEYNCVIKELDKQIALSVIGKNEAPKNKSMFLTIACAIPKKSKMEDIIDRLTQLGVDKIIPLETERVIVKLNKEKKIKKVERWQKIALSASEQSQRNNVPVIDPVTNFKKTLLNCDGYDLKLIPTLIGKRKTLKEIFVQAMPKKILVLIGPEGDFSREEVESAKKSNFIPVSLGDLVLRVETAAISVASFIKLNEDS